MYSLISNSDYQSFKLVDKLRLGDMVCHFYDPKAFGDIDDLIGDCIISIRTYLCKVHGPGIENVVAESRPATYNYHQILVYRHNRGDKHVDVSGGDFFCLWGRFVLWTALCLMECSKGRFILCLTYSGTNRIP